MWHQRFNLLILWSHEYTFCAQRNVSWYSHECTLKTDTEEKKLLNEVIIFVFFANKKYSSSFITLRLNHWCHMDYYNDVLIPFWALNVSVVLLSMQGQKALGFHQKYLILCSEDERSSYGFGTTWGWGINDRIFIFGWTMSLMALLLVAERILN